MSTNPERFASVPSGNGGPLLEYVTMPNCRDCSRLERLLSAVGGDYPGVEIREVPAQSERGRQASIEQGVLRFPVLLLDGEIIAIESIHEDDLRLHLSQATAE